MATTLLAYLLVAAFFVTEGRFRRGAAAKSLESSESDRGSTRVLGAYFV